MAANNEIGVLQPLEQLGAVCRRHGITLHSDGAQAFGTLPLNPDALGVDLLSLSAHKLYGPKGIGALVLREGIAIEPLQWGGGQEAGLRAGTLPTALIVGFAAACTGPCARTWPAAAAPPAATVPRPTCSRRSAARGQKPKPPCGSAWGARPQPATWIRPSQRSPTPQLPPGSSAVAKQGPNAGPHAIWHCGCGGWPPPPARWPPPACG